MNAYREQYMKQMTETACEIMKKPQQTEQDKMFLMNFQKELRKYEYKPFFNQLIGCAQQVVAFVRNVLPDAEETPNLDIEKENNEEDGI